MGWRKRAFSLVELLVVIAVVAVLIGMLMPALQRAREQANQIECLSNISQLTMAILMYCQDNQGWFPRAAPYAESSAKIVGPGVPAGMATGESPQDYIWWQQASRDTLAAPDRDIFNSPVLKYLGFRSDTRTVKTVVDFYEERQRVLRCPSDPLADHPNPTNEPDGPYYYSYTLNNLMQSLDPGIAHDGEYLPINVKTKEPFEVAGKLVRVRNPAMKILLVEQSETNIDDGSFDPTEGTNLLSVRHDRSAQYPPDTPSGYINVNGVWTVRNGSCKGNVSFCDGHADFVPRGYVDDPNYKINGDILCWDPLR